jgi:hypothetical protein
MNVGIHNLLAIFEVNDLRATAIGCIGIERPRQWTIRVCLITSIEHQHVIANWKVRKLKRLRLTLIGVCASLFLAILIRRLCGGVGRHPDRLLVH